MRQLFLLLLLAGLSTQAQTRPTANIPDDAAFAEGVNLNEGQVAAIEKGLDTFPDDPNAHLTLLGYYSMRKNGEGDEHSDFAKYLLWMVDHRPESVVFEFGIIQLNWEPSPTLYNEYAKHWEQAAVTHPKDSAVLSHTAEVVSLTDPILGLSYAQKSVDANGSCTRCRNVLGTIIGQIILRQSLIPRGPTRGWERKCLPDTPQAEQTVADLRLSNDPEILVDSGLKLTGEGWSGTNCSVDSEEAVHFGGELIRKAVRLDPSLIDRRHLQDILQSSNAQASPNRPANVESKRIQNIPPDEMWKRVRECLLPAYPGLAFDAHVTGTVDIGLGISPDGTVANYRVLNGPPLLVQSAVDAIREWTFRPNLVQGATTWSRVRALVRFNADGTTAVDLAPGILPDNFGDPGTPRSAAKELPRPASSPACESVQP